MPRFRPAKSALVPRQSDPLSVETVRAVVADALRPSHFYVTPGTQIEAGYVIAEHVFWEIFQGRLLDTPMTTRRQTFEAWHVFVHTADGCSPEPVLSVRLDASSGCLFVTRAIYCHAWEGYHAGDNVYLSRETRKWVRELVGTIRLAGFATAEEFRDELICVLFHAVVGTSRLPLTSVESPMPAFSLGELAYIYRSNLGVEPTPPMRTYSELIDRALHADLCWLEKAKLLETILRATPWDKLADAAETWLARWRNLGHANTEVLTLLRTLFNEVALSPYTDFVDKTLAFLDALERNEQITVEAATDLLGHLLRQLGRHLTAYDLVVFHHRGANYPDALFLDAVLKAFLKRAEYRPDLFQSAADDAAPVRRAKRLRRRGLRQAWILRSRYEGHPVPDAPTSEGENARVLPAPHVRVPEEQIVQIHRRTKRLYAVDPLSAHLGPVARAALQQCVADLLHADELRELGIALFLDRPLGLAKAAGEADHTLLFSYVAFSRSVAERRLDYLAESLKLLDTETHQLLLRQLRALPVRGIALDSLNAPERLTPVSLADTRKVADDWLFLRNTRRTTGAFLDQYDCREAVEHLGLDFLGDGWRVLMLHGFGRPDEERAGITLFDDDYRPRLRLLVDAGEGYERRGACEFPMPGLRVVQAWHSSGGEIPGADASALVIRARI